MFPCDLSLSWPGVGRRIMMRGPCTASGEILKKEWVEDLDSSLLTNQDCMYSLDLSLSWTGVRREIKVQGPCI